MTSNVEKQVSRVSAAAAADKRDSVLFLDVRTPLEYGESHIDGSVLHPLSEINVAKVEKLAAGKSACVVVCRSGSRAKQAADKLSVSEVLNVEILEGGVQAWDALGLPLVRGKAVMSLERQVRVAAGSMVFAGVVLGYSVNAAWFLLSGFVGAGLVFAGITDFCGMGLLIARMPWNNRPSCEKCG